VARADAAAARWVAREGAAVKIEAGQVAVITGAASGIGYGLAAAFAARGLSVVLSDVRDDALRRAAGALADDGAAVLAVATDVSDADAVRALSDATLERFGRVDVVCNNAGVVGRQAPMWEQSLATWRWLLDVALLGVVHGVRAFAPRLIEQGTGYFLNTASVGGLMPLPSLAPYNAAKHAVVGLTETLDAELRAVSPTLGASVLCPGMVATSLGETSRQIRPQGAETPEGNPGDDAAVPAGYAVLTPARVAELAIAGIEAERLHILTSPDSFAMVRRRVGRLLADIPG
jgi:NAD(P)-dependent dehydrogenase (short-subunit alcohol dehydrogenase family)